MVFGIWAAKPTETSRAVQQSHNHSTPVNTRGTLSQDSVARHSAEPSTRPLMHPLLEEARSILEDPDRTALSRLSPQEQSMVLRAQNQIRFKSLVAQSELRRYVRPQGWERALRPTIEGRRQAIDLLFDPIGRAIFEPMYHSAIRKYRQDEHALRGSLQYAVMKDFIDVAIDLHERRLQHTPKNR